MKNMKKIISIALASVMACTVLASCGSDTTGSNQKETITVAVMDRGQVSASEGSYDENRWTKWINENAPVNVEFVSIPRSELQSKLNLLIASGTAPDVFFDYDRNFVGRMIMDNSIQPIDEYVEQYSTTYKQYISEHPELTPYVSVDGQSYAFTSARGDDSIANQVIFIRQDWLDKLNLETPKTAEDLINVARAFTKNDPDGNGVDDTYGVAATSAFPIIADAMFFCGSLWYDEGGSLEFASVSDRRVAEFEFLRTLYSEGLIDSEFFTDNNYTRAKQQWTTGKAGMYFSSINSHYYKDLLANDPNAVVVPLTALSTEYGTNGLWQEAPPRLYVMMNAETDKQEAIVKYIDWMLEDGWMPLTYGEEGVHYEMQNNQPVIIDQDKFDKEVKYAAEYVLVSQGNKNAEYYRATASSDPILQKDAYLTADAIDAALTTSMRRDIPYEPILDETATIWSEFDPILSEQRVKAMTGSDGSTPQSAYEKLVSEWQRLGGDNVTKAMNDWYAQNKDQFAK